MPQLQAAKQAHRTTVQSSTPDVVKYLQEVLGQKLTAYVADVSDPRTVARWAAGERSPRGEHEQRLRCAYQIFLLLLEQEAPPTIRAWFLGLNPQLDDEAPAESIHKGMFRETLLAAKAFLAGA